jgi:hypothetical protein
MRYKQNRAAYLERQDIDLSQEHKERLLAMQQLPAEEVSTVMRLTIEPHAQTAAPTAQDGDSAGDAEDGTIYLDDVKVEVVSRAHTFLAEATDPGPGVECRLLKHSYIYIVSPPGTKPVDLAMHLNICYVDPTDPHDIPQVLTIKSHYPKPEHAALNLSDVKIEFQARKFVLLRPDEPVACIFEPKTSYYDPANGSLYLVPVPIKGDPQT